MRFSWPWSPTEKKLDRVGLEQDQLTEIWAALTKRGALPNRCNACGRPDVGLMLEMAQLQIGPNPGAYDGNAIPSAILLCSNCGNIRIHSLGALGLLELGTRKTRKP